MSKEKSPGAINPQLLINASDLGNTTDALTSDEAQAKAVNTLADTTDFRTMTDMDVNEVKLLTALDAVSKELEDELLESVVENFARWKVSKERKGRGEIKDVARSTEESEAKKMNKLKQWIGMGRV